MAIYCSSFLLKVALTYVLKEFFCIFCTTMINTFSVVILLLEKTFQHTDTLK